MEHYDVIIIGTGAGGGTLAHRLAPSGKRILLLERGGYLPREPENWDSHEVFNNDRYLSGEKWLDKDGAAFEPHQQYFVGGNTKFYGAILFRLRERDFGEVRHYGGMSPAWPIVVRGPRALLHGGRAALPRPRAGGRGPDRAVALGPFPYPAVSHEPRIQQLHDDFAAHRPPPVPPAGRRRPGRDRSRGGPLRALRPLRRLPVPRRRQGRRARAVRAARARARQRQAAHARERGAARDRPPRPLGDRGRRRPHAAARSATAPTSWSSRAAR